MTSFFPCCHEDSHILNVGQWLLSRDLVMNVASVLGAHRIGEDK